MTDLTHSLPTGKATSNPTSTPGTILSLAFEVATHALAIFLFLFLLVIVPIYERFLDERELKLPAACVMVLRQAHFAATYWYVVVLIYVLVGLGLFGMGRYLAKTVPWLRLCVFIGSFSVLVAYFFLTIFSLLLVLVGQPGH